MPENNYENRKLIRKTIFRVMAVLLCICFVLTNHHTIHALTADQAVVKLTEIMKKEYPKGKRFESSGFANAWQCFGFAKKIVYLLTGDVTNWKYSGQAVSGLYTVAQLKRGGYSKNKMQEFIDKALPGDIIQADTGTRDRQHTMIYCWKNTNSTFTVYDANTVGSNVVAIRDITYTRWSSKSWKSITLLRSVRMESAKPTNMNNASDKQGSTNDSFSDAIFDAEFYAGRYEDLKELAGDEAALYNHFMKTGIAEGRSASPVLDLPYYIALNPDLQEEFGNDYKSAYDHFITTGCNEYRKSSELYDGSEYKESDKELEKLGSKELILHYLETQD